MKEIIKKVLNEQSDKRIVFDDADLPRMINPQKVSTFTIKKYMSRGYNPYYVDNGVMVELPVIPRERMNTWGVIYFFNDEEVEKIMKVQENVEKIKEQIKKQMDLYDQFVLSFIHHKII